MHLEGPFISKEKKGAHPEKCIIADLSSESSESHDPIRDMYGDRVYDNTAIITLAPEIPGALDVIHELAREKNITVSIGKQ